jgi:GT2 family glycosyltransferase
MWGGQEELLKYSGGKYIVCAAVDVILDKDFIKIAIQEMDADSKIGALQAKIYTYSLQKLEIATRELYERSSRRMTGNWELEIGGTIDTCGFEAFRSRRIVNIGHGQKDSPEFSVRKEIFAVEGAIPVFKKEALEDCEIKIPNSEIIDHDFFWYADDLDLAWRMTLFGWKQIFVPSLIAWHDRQTTKKLRSGWFDFIKLRRAIPMKKRRLDWRNTHFTILKNDYIINILKDLPHIVRRELMLFAYICIFEPAILLELPSFLRLMPKMIKKRRSIMRKARVSALEMRKFFR